MNWSRAVLLLSVLMAPMAYPIDLSRAVVVAPPGLTGPERRAVRMLVEEAEKRTRLRWPLVAEWPKTNATVIAVGPVSLRAGVNGPHGGRLPEAQDPTAAEGYRIVAEANLPAPGVIVLGADERGVLFGVGRLLREMRLGRGSATLPDGFDLTDAPKAALRGHQLGYRPKCNSYDAWDLPVWEQYIRDLAVFGDNAIELIPPRSDDAADSPHFPRPPMEMMIGMSQLAADYGLQVWIWYPAMDPDYGNAQTVAAAQTEWESVLARLPRVDAVFVPGGDPGHTEPKHLMVLLERQAEGLRRHHPKAQLWVSPQGFTQAWLDEFTEILKQQQPNWLGGVVFGPQVRVSVQQLRQEVPRQFPIRHYPDITHSRQCEYPVPDWDAAFALTEGRECINPRPEGEAVIFRQTQPDTIGFISYSEGCNDDVNKFVWLGLGWNPKAQPLDILRQFSRYFIGEAQAEGFAQGLEALERNWSGPVAANEGIETTLAQFQAMERAATPDVRHNWRFQQALFRAYYDAYIRRRFIFEAALEDRAMEKLANGATLGGSGSLGAMAAAEAELSRAVAERPAGALRARAFELGEALFHTIGMQLSVEKYLAIDIDRGASLDTIDYPLNNRPWLEHQFAAIRRLGAESNRLKALEEMVQWTNPGPGGFYDDLGNPARQPHLVRGQGFEKDPGCYASARSDFEEDLVLDEDDDKPDGPRRKSWIDHAESLYDAPLQMHYGGLDPQARYKVRVVYAGDAAKKKIRLATAEGVEIHPFIAKPWPFKPIEFSIPAAATAHGELTLSWFGEPGLGGNGRGCQVSEVWLIRDPAAQPR